MKFWTIWLVILLWAGGVQAREAYVFVVSPMTSPTITMETYYDLVNYLSRKLGRPVILKQRRTYEEVNRMLASGEADFGHVCTGAFLAGRKDFGLKLLAIPVIHGRYYYQAYIIVAKDSPYRRFEDLRGKTFVFTDPLSLTGRLYVLARLRTLGTSPEKLFRKVFYSHGHEKSIEIVAAGLVDGASVDSLVFEDLKVRGISYVNKVRILEKSPLLGIPPFVASPESPEEFRRKVLSLLLHMPEDPEGRVVLQKMGIERFLPPKHEIYRQTLEILKRCPF
ncbi:PhnD/SsuA/transferrin family substrate-binding protein [Thermosulfurimonas marina]|uniref:PhnD/SsuA/transferrin family substrate-binding protein n=1 Tax=Thermosulfurimonas marina TaxID=2047767 RepID=A0A6H1WTM7_9BACT|nr:PhnD/SsuA/transferrin family substrate-binding protein [Thermosulfurimonas marina]QJA06538.1 PhnD/SsuA/transferrin family substrate-binding protein [Thermosulfurimonas marina]